MYLRYQLDMCTCMYKTSFPNYCCVHFYCTNTRNLIHYSHHVYVYSRAVLFFPSATAMMIKNLLFTTYHYTISLRWQTPHFLPSVYHLTSTHNYIGCHRTSMHRSDTISSIRTDYIFDNLHPGSQYEIKIVAMYNPASNDPGISRKFSTPITRKDQ